MKPEISEFSYGFAVTKELVDWQGHSITAAPLFPSLLEEGKVGYDLKLEDAGIPVFFQFKISDYMKTRKARESATIIPPFYRMKLWPSRVSNQHNLLLELEKRNNLVYYVAPAIHLIEQFNRIYREQRIVQESVFIRPSSIGSFADNDEHFVVFRDSHSTAYRFSSPIPIQQRLDFDNFTREITLKISYKRESNLKENLYHLVVDLIETLSHFYESDLSFRSWLSEYYDLLISMEDSWFRMNPGSEFYNDDFFRVLQQFDSLGQEFFHCSIFIMREKAV